LSELSVEVLCEGPQGPATQSRFAGAMQGASTLPEALAGRTAMAAMAKPLHARGTAEIDR